MTQIETPPRPHAGDGSDPEFPAAPAGRRAPALLDLPRGLRRFWWLILGLAVLLGAVGVYVGANRGATYSATASVNVGRVDVRSQALPGYMSAAQALAASYSRVATGDKAVAAIGNRLHLSPQTVADRLNAGAVPKAPIFLIIGHGPSAAAAIALANAGTDQILRYVSSTNAGNSEATSILNAYRREARRAASFKLKIARLRTQGASARAISKVQLALQTSKVRLDGLSTQYQAQSQEVLSTAGVEVLDRPTRATSNHSKTIKQYGGAGAVAGLLLGVALALGIERWTARRRRRTA